MHDESSQDKAAALKVTVFASISLALMGVDYLLLVRDEFKYVWPRLCSSWAPWIYIFTRYLGLASQIFNLYFTMRMYLGVYTSSNGCRLWFMFQAVVVQFLLFFVEGLLMHRIYALFLRNRLVLLILVLLIVGQMVSMWVSAKLSFPTNEYTSTCLMVRSNPGGAFFSATTMATNMVIFFMTFWRYLGLPTKWTRQGLGRVVFRDSVMILGAISAMMLFLTLCSLDVIKPRTSGNATYYWLVGILWVSIGRIIVNHEKVKQDAGWPYESEMWKGTLQITSQIEMGENTLTAEAHLRRHSTRSPRKLSGTLASVCKISQLAPSSSECTSDVGPEWPKVHPQLDKLRQHVRRSSGQPALFLDIPVTKEDELSSWSRYTNDAAWQWVEGEDGLTEMSVPSCTDGDGSLEQDITDAEGGRECAGAGVEPLNLVPAPLDVS